LRRIILAVAAVATTALAVSQPLSASPPNQAQGTEVTTVATTVDSRSVGGNLIEERVANRVLSGTFAGTLDSRFTRVTFEDGDRFSQGFETCDPCTVDGRTGTVVFRFEAHTSDKTNGTVALLTIVDATGGLEGLHGFLRVVNGVYTGSYHFDPV
jgi:hypothetical protein